MKNTNKPKPINNIKCVFPAKSVNEGLSRMITAAFISQLDPTISELTDMKTVISEAVTNCIVHAYKDAEDKTKALVYITGKYYADGKVVIRIRDRGIGIEDIKQARQPLFTTDKESERSGMGFTIMESFTDKLKVYSKKGKGTTVVIEKRIGL